MVPSGIVRRREAKAGRRPTARPADESLDGDIMDFVAIYNKLEIATEIYSSMYPCFGTGES
jgi:hypothetical protein